MTDERLRNLQRRWQETGSVHDEAAYLLERVRVGNLSKERLELAAYCGHEGAREALGLEGQVQRLVGNDHSEWVNSEMAKGTKFTTVDFDLGGGAGPMYANDELLYAAEFKAGVASLPTLDRLALEQDDVELAVLMAAAVAGLALIRATDLSPQVLEGQRAQLSALVGSNTAPKAPHPNGTEDVALQAVRYAQLTRSVDRLHGLRQTIQATEQLASRQEILEVSAQTTIEFALRSSVE